METQTIAYFNSNDGTSILAIGETAKIRESGVNSMASLTEFLHLNEGAFICGGLSYDLKNNFEDLSSNNRDGIEFPDVLFWVPEFVVKLDGRNKEIIYGESKTENLSLIDELLVKLASAQKTKDVFDFKPSISKEKYLADVGALKHEIQMGNIYEINFCQEFYAENCSISDPFSFYAKLNELTKAPFSTFLKIDEFQVFCGSPERFLQRKENQLISQPIKGTAKRGKTKEEDECIKTQLKNDPKERTENIMIVDLVRNDLSRIAKKSSVKVDELCEIYSFETVHQMISTISCEVEDALSFSNIITATFPMGSMTGVPKYRATQLSEKYEVFKRGLYSGSIGYILPNGDFDFNVVIRTFIYNKVNQYLSCAVGGAITISSVAEKEYEECEVKVKKILDGINK